MILSFAIFKHSFPREMRVLIHHKKYYTSHPLYLLTALYSTQRGVHEYPQCNAKGNRATVSYKYHPMGGKGASLAHSHF